MTVTLRPTRYEELELLSRMDEQPHARRFIIPTPLSVHREWFGNQDIDYLSIMNARGELAGYFILVSERDSESVEFRRILIDANERGIGQSAIGRMEQFCRDVLEARRIWLDVFDDNGRGKHIYEKLGYVWFKSEPRGERLLHFYEKSL